MSTEFWLGVVAGASGVSCVFLWHWLLAVPPPPRVEPGEPPIPPLHRR